MRKKKRLYFFIKRFCDIIFAVLGMLITSPIWLVAIIGIVISDPGPIFYMANRVGKDNKQFRMFKFRSMRVDKNADEKSLRPDQDRIFPFGRFLRDTKIDELPQLLNVLFGDMSVVGPRPAAMDQVSVTRSGDNAIVSTIKPGLTSPSALYDYIYGDKVTGEDEYTRLVLPTRLKLDLVYLYKMGIMFDIRMIWWTVISIIATVFQKAPMNLLHQLESWASVSIGY